MFFMDYKVPLKYSHIGAKLQISGTEKFLAE